MNGPQRPPCYRGGSTKNVLGKNGVDFSQVNGPHQVGVRQLWGYSLARPWVAANFAWPAAVSGLKPLATVLCVQSAVVNCTLSEKLTISDGARFLFELHRTH